MVVSFRSMSLWVGVALLVVLTATNTVEVEASRLKQHINQRGQTRQAGGIGIDDSSSFISSKYKQPIIDPMLELNLLQHHAVAADYLADYAAFENEEYEDSIMAMLEEHIAMTNPIPPNMGQRLFDRHTSTQQRRASGPRITHVHSGVMMER